MQILTTETKQSFLAPRYWLTWLSVALLRLVVCLPQSWQRALGRLLGAALYRIAGKRRKVVDVNLRLCFPELSAEQRQSRVKAVFAENGIGIFETAMAWWSAERAFNGQVELIGEEYLQQARQQGKGVILLSAHFTMLDLGGYLLSLKYPLDGVYRQHNNPLFDQVIRRGRERFLQQAIERGNMRQMVRRLKKGSFIWYAPDQDHGPELSVYAPFFGVPAATVTGTARLARMSGATVLMYAFRRTERGYQLELSPPLENFPSGDDEADCTLVNQQIEAAIRKAPDQYMWVHRRFKTHPQGKNYLYQQSYDG